MDQQGSIVSLSEIANMIIEDSDLTVYELVRHVFECTTRKDNFFIVSSVKSCKEYGILYMYIFFFKKKRKKKIPSSSTKSQEVELDSLNFVQLVTYFLLW